MSYQDPKIRIADGTMSIAQYYFPFATAKHVRLADLDHVGTYDMGAMTGRWRVWGSGDLRHWFNNDGARPRKTRAFILYPSRGWVRPVVTPDRPDEFQRELEQAGVRVAPAQRW